MNENYLRGELKNGTQEHLAMATDFAKNMLERFNAQEQNEIIQHIKGVFIKDRKHRIEQLRINLEQTEKMLSVLIDNSPVIMS